MTKIRALLLVLGFHAYLVNASTCSPSTPCILTLEEQRSLIAELKREASSDRLVRMVSDGEEDVADPTRPEFIELPNGQKKYLIGLSSQRIMLLDSLKNFTKGGTYQLGRVDLRNQSGFQYGAEIMGSGYDSSTWDLALSFYRKANGQMALKVFAGAMGDDSSGRPLMLQDGHNNTRQRVFFDGEWVASNDGFTLLATNPQTILNEGQPLDGNWVELGTDGKVIFNHGYGGEPVTLPSGEFYEDERGWVPFVHEIVVEQRNYLDPHAQGGIRKVPYRTAIVVTYLNRQLSQVMEKAKIIFDVYKPDGTLWKATLRDSAGPLVEGPHIEVRSRGRVVKSLSDLRELRKKKTTLEFQMLFSAGEFFGHYGSYFATSSGDLHHFRPLLDKAGELYDITSPLRVLFTWIGRPVSFHVGEKEYLLIHGVDRSSIPTGMRHEGPPQIYEWVFYKRQLIVVPVKRVKGQMELDDESGLISFLQNYTHGPFIKKQY